MSNEHAWFDDPMALMSLQLSPFIEELTPTERMNAQTRLLIVLGTGLALIERRAGSRNVIILVTILFIVHIGVQHVIGGEKVLYTPQKKESPSSQLLNMPSPFAAAQPSHHHHNRQRNPMAATQRRQALTQPLDSGISLRDPSVRMPTMTELITADQQAYARRNYMRKREPTRFDTQNYDNGLYSKPLRMPGSDYTPDRDLGNIHPNPGAFDFGTAVRSLNPPAYTFETDTIARMYRSVDDVDPGLVTNPIPDPTFMARQPQFDVSYENEAIERLRLESGSGFRFW